MQITELMSRHWATVLNGQQKWPVQRGRKNERQAADLRSTFITYIEKTLHWLDYFVRDPRWLNLSAVNYAANAAREAAQEVRQARAGFEELYELDRTDLVPGSIQRSAAQLADEIAAQDGSEAAPAA